ncbi:MAG: hypothetical protein H0T42_09290 [Deltaproteobacteria bacterium]|nr:hypothetical protein [Deltaproteobacteria bacterium]
MNDLLHRTSERTQPLWQRLVEKIRSRPIVGADETRLLMQDHGTGKVEERLCLDLRRAR